MSVPNTTTKEQDFRLGILNTLLSTPHGNIAPVIPVFARVHENDPLFFGHLAAWYCQHGSVRDLRELFVAHMCVSDFSPEYREAGKLMLSDLPPYQVANVLRMIKGHKFEGKFVPGLSESVPRSVKTAVAAYLHKREGNQNAFDQACLNARQDLKYLYSTLRIKPGQYAQKVLFDEQPPEDSKLFQLKRIAASKNPAEQAALIVEYGIPYRAACSVIKNMTPSVVVALVDAMSSQELINNMGSLKKRGALDNPDLRKIINSKLELAKKDKRVHALKSQRANEAVALDAELSKQMASVADAQIKSKGQIKKSTAILVDKSGSMEMAIEVGKRIAAIVAPICQRDLFVYAFDTVSYAVTASGLELSDWEKAFKGIIAAGGTSCGVSIAALLKKRQLVEQIVMITDQGENTRPTMLSALEQYKKELNVDPNVIFINVGQAGNSLEEQLNRAGFEVDSYKFDGDYYSLPNLIPLLAGGTRLELLMDILDYPLPVAKEVLKV